MCHKIALSYHYTLYSLVILVKASMYLLTVHSHCGCSIEFRLLHVRSQVFTYTHYVSDVFIPFPKNFGVEKPSMSTKIICHVLRWENHIINLTRYYRKKVILLGRRVFIIRTLLYYNTRVMYLNSPNNIPPPSLIQFIIIVRHLSSEFRLKHRYRI